MIDYFMTPVICDNEKQALAGISGEISRENNLNPIACVPDQFQVWKLGEIDHEGNLIPGLELICTCNTLIRRAAPEPVAGKTQETIGGRQAGTLRPLGNGGPYAEALPESKSF